MGVEGRCVGWRQEARIHARERLNHPGRRLDQEPSPGGGRERSRVFYGLSEDLCEAVRRLVAGGEPEIDPAADHLWQWFWDVHRGRQAGMNGWLALSATELKAWAELTGEIVRPEEWQIIRKMDQAFLEAVGKRGEGGTADTDQEINAAAFDAVFG